MYAAAACAALVLQITWLSRLPFGAAVDPLLLIVVSVGLLHGPEEGAAVGAASGLLQDVMTGAPLGLGMLSLLGVGFCAGLGERSISVEYVWLPGLAAAVLTLLRTALWAGVAHLVGLLSASPLEVAWVGLLSACYNGIVAVPVFRGLRRFDRALVRLYERHRPV